MSKIEEAQDVLKELGLPRQQQNKICALTLLALADIRNESQWSSAKQNSLTLSKDIIEFVNREYHQDYKANTRESFRTIALRPFIKHSIAVHNPDDPSLKPNSSKTHYALSDLTVKTIRKYKTSEWKASVKNFKSKISLKNRLVIKNFKSIKEVEFDISRVNVFIGRPNSGKSNLLEALTLFNFIQPRRNQFNEPGIIRYNSLDNLFFDRDLDNEIEVSLGTNQTLFSYQSRINTFFHIVNPSSEYLRNVRKLFASGLSLNNIEKQFPFLSPDPKVDKYSSKFEILDANGGRIKSGQVEERENPIRRYEFKDGSSYGDTFSTYLKTYGENLFTIVRENSELLEWINSFYEEYQLEFLIDFSSKAFEIQKKQKGFVYKIPFELTPDTFRRMLFNIAAIYSNENATILLEEPEAHSFPPYVKELSELIKRDHNNNNYFITTHSPYFFNSMVEDAKKFRDVSFFHVYYDDFQTKIKKLSSKELDNIWGNGADVFFNIDSLNK